MILTCPKCSTRFLLPAQVLSPEGQNVKCSNCGEVWNQLPDPDELISDLEDSIEEIPEAVKPVPEGSSVPAVRVQDDEDEDDGSHAVAMGYGAATAVFVLVLGVLVFMKGTMINTWPASAAIYQLIGMDVTPPGAGVEFDRVEAVMDDTGALMVEGLMINLKAKDVALPMITASVKNAHGEVIAQWMIEPPESELGGEATLAFSSHSAVIKGTAESLHLHFTLGGGEVAAVEVEHMEATEHHEEPHKDDHHKEPHHEEAHHDDPHHDNGH